MAKHHPYFTEFTLTKGIFYGAVLLYVLSVCLVVCLEPILITGDCELPPSGIEYVNPSYVENPCGRQRRLVLLFLTSDECSYGRRLVCAVLLGGTIGWERRTADRPAGIRTLSLVSLGACLFTINSAFAFVDGPMGWDSSRIAAAIPSGVGFLGAGLIFKEAVKDDGSGDTTHVVHGLTTAASVWLSAAVGTACAGQLYFAATFSTAVMLVLLRFGPRIQQEDDEEEEEEGFPDDQRTMSGGGFPANNYNTGVAFGASAEDVSPLDPEKQPLKGGFDMSLSQRSVERHSMSVRKRATLGGLV